MPIGGSNTPSFRAFPHDNFSVRWTGKVVPRFGEKYTFTADSAAGVKIWLNGSAIVHLCASRPATGDNAVSLTAGTSYDFKVEFRQGAGPARMILKRSSPSTPEEVIDPLSVSGFNLTNCGSVLFADDVKYCLADEAAGEPRFWYNPGNSRDPGIPLRDLDSDLWPKKDGVLWVNPYFPNATYCIRFNGKADVSCCLRWFGRQGTFTVNSQKVQPDAAGRGRLRSGQQYDDRFHDSAPR